MAGFTEAYKAVIKRFEGGYSNLSSDLGGETIYGISRVHHPKWVGWKIVDQLKKSSTDSTFVAKVNNNTEVRELAIEFYKDRWDKFSGEDIPDQDIANKLFDLQTLMGHRGMTQLIQRLLNVFNKQGTLYPDIVVDGGFGPKTLGSLMSNLDEFGSSNLITGLNVLQAYKLIELAEKNETQEDNMNGWFNRVRLSES